jgi:hypothetical protein
MDDTAVIIVSRAAASAIGTAVGYAEQAHACTGRYLAEWRTKAACAKECSDSSDLTVSVWPNW